MLGTTELFSTELCLMDVRKTTHSFFFSKRKNKLKWNLEYMFIMIICKSSSMLGTFEHCLKLPSLLDVENNKLFAVFVHFLQFLFIFFTEDTCTYIAIKFGIQVYNENIYVMFNVGYDRVIFTCILFKLFFQLHVSFQTPI